MPGHDNYEQVKPLIEGYLRNHPLPLVITDFVVDDFRTDDYACLVLMFNSPELIELNQIISETFSCIPNQYDEYQPHITVGYLKPAYAEQARQLLQETLKTGGISATFSTITVNN